MADSSAPENDGIPEVPVISEPEDLALSPPTAVKELPCASEELEKQQRRRLEKRKRFAQYLEERYIPKLVKKMDEWEQKEVGTDDLERDGSKESEAIEMFEQMRRKYGEATQALRIAKGLSAESAKLFQYSGTPYDCINKAISHYVNSSDPKPKFGPYRLPNYEDMRKLIADANNDHNLMLSERDLEEMPVTEAEKVVKILKRKRREDLKLTTAEYEEAASRWEQQSADASGPSADLPSTSADTVVFSSEPPTLGPELELRLEKNNTEADRQFDELFAGICQKMELEGEGIEEGVDTSESGRESDEEEEVADGHVAVDQNVQAKGQAKEADVIELDDDDDENPECTDDSVAGSSPPSAAGSNHGQDDIPTGADIVAFERPKMVVVDVIDLTLD